jgi:hypothetical protein
MMRTLILISVVVSAPSFAQPADAVSWMTGEHLVKMMGNVDPNTVTWTPESPFRSKAVAAEYMDMVRGEYVRGFIQGVHDASEGKKWCWSSKYKPKAHEMEADARHALQGMPPVQLKRNAADLIAEVWRKSWPCPSQTQRRPQ